MSAEQATLVIQMPNARTPLEVICVIVARVIQETEKIAQVI